MIKHHATCHADYPEKLETELPQATVEIEGIVQCVDCGAFETSVTKTAERLGERIRRRDNKIERLQRKIKQLEKQLEFLQ